MTSYNNIILMGGYLMFVIAIVFGIVIGPYAVTNGKLEKSTMNLITIILALVGLLSMYVTDSTYMHKHEDFQHAATHKVVVENENGGYITGSTNNLSDYVQQEIPKSTDTPYMNDVLYRQDISSELYEGFEHQETDQQSQESVKELPDNDTPVTNMTQPDIEDSIVVPRIIKALPNKRNRGQGDPIRGDLAIAPEPCGWFRPSASPNIDLRQGALNVIAGEENEQGKSITNLINSTSGSIYIAGKPIDEPEMKVETSEAMYAV